MAAITRTSTVFVRDDPTRSNSPSCSTRRNFTWMSGARSPISSRKIVPPSASSKRPCRSATAPVKAPFSWPNSSLSTSVGGSAAQLTRTSGRACRRLRSCSARANSSLPVPVGPEQQHARVRRRHLRQPRQRQPQRRALADDVVEVVIALDLLFQIHVVGFEPGVELLDHGDVGAQRALVARRAAAPRRGSRTAAAGARPAAAASAAAAGRCRSTSAQTTCPPSDAGTPRIEQAPRPARLLAAGDRLPRKLLRPRDGHQLAARRGARPARPRAPAPDASVGAGAVLGGGRASRATAPDSANSSSWQPSARVAAAISRERLGDRRGHVLERHARQPSRERDGELRELFEVRFGQGP